MKKILLKISFVLAVSIPWVLLIALYELIDKFFSNGF